MILDVDRKKADQTCRDPYLISNKYQNVLELLGN